MYKLMIYLLILPDEILSYEKHSKKSYRKNGDYVEVNVPVKADYGTVCREAAEVLN